MFVYLSFPVADALKKLNDTGCAPEVCGSLTTAILRLTGTASPETVVVTVVS